MKRAGGHPIVAAILDVSMRGLERVRHKVVPRASGHVLELGVGTGLNLPSYDGVASITGVEPDPHMMKRARRRAEALGVDVLLEEVSAERLPFGDGAFDTVVTTFVLCTIPDPIAALREARRVLKDDGVLLFAEHVASSYPVPRRVQETIDPMWGHFAGGCHLNRDALALLEEAGFSDIEHRTHGQQRFTISPVISGTARP